MTKTLPPNKVNRIIGGLYFFTVAIFAVLEPWGSVDTRDFSYLSFQKFWEYNFYIGFVLLGMIMLGVKLWRNNIKQSTLVSMAVINTMFIVMVLFDLLHFFPDPAQPLPFLVTLIEVVTAVICLGIILYLPRVKIS